MAARSETFKDKVDKWIPWDRFLNYLTFLFLGSIAFMALFVF